MTYTENKGSGPLAIRKFPPKYIHGNAIKESIEKKQVPFINE